MFANLEYVRKYAAEVEEAREICKEKTKLAIEEKYLPWSTREMTLIGEQSQNIALTHTCDEQPGES